MRRRVVLGFGVAWLALRSARLRAELVQVREASRGSGEPIAVARVAVAALPRRTAAGRHGAARGRVAAHRELRRRCARGARPRRGPGLATCSQALGATMRPRRRTLRARRGRWRREQFGADAVATGTSTASASARARRWARSARERRLRAATLYATPDGKLLWTGTFDHTQVALGENALTAARYPGGGTRWLTRRGARALGRRRGRQSMPFGGALRRPVARGSVTAFEVIPAIDLLGGRCVRLSQGDYDRVDGVRRRSRRRGRRASPALGAPRIHVVDLDGARSGRPQNRAAVRAIVAAAQAASRCSSAAGCARSTAVEDALGLGVDRVDPRHGRAARSRAGARGRAPLPGAHRGRHRRARRPRRGRGLARDQRRRRPSSSRAASRTPASRRSSTPTSRATAWSAGPNLEATAALAAAVSIPVIVSGGVGSRGGRARAAACDAGHRRASIVGRALYTGDVDLARALAVARRRACC